MTYTYDEAFEATKKYFNGEELPTKVAVDKYLLRDNKNQLVELTPDDKHRRIAKELARIEAKKFKTPYTEEEIYGWLKNYGKIIPQGSPMFGIGNKSQYITISNCYVVNPPLDSYGGIHLTDQQLTQISKRRGGVGTDISYIRPRNTPTRNSSRRSTGIVPFMERFSNSIREVGQDGRRGALMLTIDVHHPEVLDFARVKLDKTKVTGANISIRLSDEFLTAVKNKTTYEQRWSSLDGKVKISQWVDANEVWNEIIKCAHDMAEPGLLFWDNILRDSPADCYYQFGFRTISTNPCCFAANKNVWVITNNGIKEIKDIVSTDKVWINETKSWANTSGYFKAGKAKVYKVCFKNGEELFITNNHKLCVAETKRNGNKIDYLEGELKQLSELSIGDKIYLHNTEVANEAFGLLGSYDEGLILGSMSGDGCLSFHEESDQYPSTILDFWSEDLDTGIACEAAFHRLGFKNNLIDCDKSIGKKRLRSELFTEYFVNKYQNNIWLFKSENAINPFLFKASKDFIKGYLQTYFAADGTVQCETINSNYSIQLSSINKNRLIQIQCLLNLFGIKSSIALTKEAGEAEFKGKTYPTKDCWRLTLTGIDNIKKFSEEIGILHTNKSQKLNEICNIEQQKASKNLKYTTITSIEEVGYEEVGCIEVQDYHKFTANTIISGNSELPLCILDSCRLLVLNLMQFVKNAFTKAAYFCAKTFYKFAQIAQRLMDDIVDLELECIDKILDKIKQDPEDDDTKQVELYTWEIIREKCFNGRRTGLGITALGDTIAALGVEYGSKDSIKITEEIFKILKFGSYRSSVDMAKELGAFPIWNWELEKDNDFIKRIAEENIYIGELCITGQQLVDDIREFGRRNIANLTCAPTGSLSMLANCVNTEEYDSDYIYGTSSGIEPVIMLLYIRRKKGNPSDENFRADFVDQNGDKWQEFTVHHPTVKHWMRVTGETDIKKSPWYGCCAEEINWKNRVQLQAAAQRHLDHAISSTINLPEDVSVEKVAEIYEEAWKAGLKGITVYRKNCRTGVLVEKKQETAVINHNHAPKRPKELQCDIHHIKIRGDKEYFVLVGLLDNHPYEVLAGVNGQLSKNCHKGTVTKIKRGHYKLVAENGETMESVTDLVTDDEEAITRMVSTALRHGAEIDFIVTQLQKTKGHLTGFSKSLARALKQYVKDGKKVSGVTCPECKQESLVFSDGCQTCSNCGHSKCS